MMQIAVIVIEIAYWKDDLNIILSYMVIWLNEGVLTKVARHLWIIPRWLFICIMCFTWLSALCSPSAWVSQVHPEHLASITLCHMQIIVGRYFENISTLYLSIYRDVCIIDVSIFNLKYGLMFPNMS